MLDKFRIKGFDIGENYQLIDCGRVSDVHRLCKFRIRFLPLLGCAAEENHVQKICFACINEALLHLAKKYGIAPSKITEWKNELLNNADKAFGKDTESKSELKKVTAEKDRLLKKVGQLTIDCDFFAKACEDAGLKVR